MKLIQCRFSSGQRLPLLVQAGDAVLLQYSEAIFGLEHEVIVRTNAFYTRPTTCFQALGCTSCASEPLSRYN
jgi:hypothetical protein